MQQYFGSFVKSIGLKKHNLQPTDSGNLDCDGYESLIWSFLDECENSANLNATGNIKHVQI